MLRFQAYLDEAYLENLKNGTIRFVVWALFPRMSRCTAELNAGQVAEQSIKDVPLCCLDMKTIMRFSLFPLVLTKKDILVRAPSPTAKFP